MKLSHSRMESWGRVPFKVLQEKQNLGRRNKKKQSWLAKYYFLPEHLRSLSVARRASLAKAPRTCRTCPSPSSAVSHLLLRPNPPAPPALLHYTKPVPTVGAFHQLILPPTMLSYVNSVLLWLLTIQASIKCHLPSVHPF